MLVLASALLGALVGMLVPAAAYRRSVPFGAAPRSRCDSCASPLRGRVLTRCAGCGARIGPRWWLTVPVGAATFGTLSWALGPVPALPAFLVVAGFGVLLAAIDLACLRLPDPLVAAAALAAVVGLLAASLAGGEFGPLVRAGSAAVAMFVGYLVLALIPGANLGFGDVKLAGLLGLMLGWIGWPAVLFGALLPHLINGPLVLLLLLSGKARRDTQLPLGPALLAGAWLAIVGLAVWSG